MNSHVLAAVAAMAAATLSSQTTPHPTQAKDDPWKRHHRGSGGHTAKLAQRLGGKVRESRSR